MYCSSCGAGVTNNLTYCNKCGAKLNDRRGDGSKASEISPNILVAAMVFIFLFGMATGVALIKATANPFAVVLLALNFLLIVGLEGVFIWILLRRRKDFKTAAVETQQIEEKMKAELYSAPARVLTEPIPSVTDHTTNRLEQVYQERKTK